jgi:hypothetical protein
VVLIADRANLNDELALSYEKNKLKYLAGLQPQKKIHKQLVEDPSRRYLRQHPLGSWN